MLKSSTERKLRANQNFTFYLPYSRLSLYILYLNLGSKEGGCIPEAIDAKGIIIDLRCYPTSQKVKGYWDFEQLYPNSTAFAKLTKPSIETPGLFSFKSVSTVGKKTQSFLKVKKSS
ncbi:MAG: hypothetical protein H6Q13_2502 [Bacteroidetes bacterium]|nr:hypothetical protein [Bacteroidota bacterium]